MKFLSTLLALPLLSVVFANPVPSAELAARDAENALAGRTFFEHDWRCLDLVAKLLCAKKGGDWACDKSCHCVEKPQPCPDYCPNRDWSKSKCDKDQGKWNDDRCGCDAPKCPDCDNKGKDCTSKGGKWDEAKCYCTPKPQDPPKGECNDWWKVWLCKLKGKGCDYQCNCH